jgi:hypothetical protein
VVVVDFAVVVRGVRERCTGHRPPRATAAIVNAVLAQCLNTKEELTMPQYLLSVWHDDNYELDFSTPDAKRRFGQVEALNTELQGKGVWLFAAGLHPASSGTVVRSTGGEVSMTDGPYAETKEQMGGFWVIDAPDFDGALEWAAKAAAACEGPIEVRPVQGG